MKTETYRQACEIVRDSGTCRAIVDFVDKYMPPNGTGYVFKIVLHDKECDCPPWLYRGIRDICENKQKELAQIFKDL